MINIDFSGIQLKLRKQDGCTQVFDPIRKKWLVLTPEEHVRQYLVAYLLNVMNYPAALFAVEKMIKVGSMSKRFDVVVYGRDHKPWLLAECKAPEVAVSENTLHQLLQYQHTVQCRYWLLTNGHQLLCADAGDVEHIEWLKILPGFNQ